MDVTNAAGRKVSLLNDHEPHHQLARINSFTPSMRSRTSSYTSSPIGSPPTPQLMRSNSSDSTSMQSHSAHSPVTPDFNMDGPFMPLESPTFSQNGFFPPQKDMNSVYAQLPSSSGPLAYPHMAPAQMQMGMGYYQQPPPPPVEQQQPAPSVSTPPNGRPKKNSYPCPMAKLYNCADFFTTSGHAARHAKKHTGKKDAACPECMKTFTRKDNMEQHRRTHQNGRNAPKAGDRDTKRTKKQAKRSTPAPLQASDPSMAPQPMVDPSLPISPAGPYLAATVLTNDPYMDFPQRTAYPDPTSYAMTTAYNAPSSYHGLDALAIAASSEKRKFEP